VDETEIANIDYELATLPRWLGWWSVPLGLGLAVLVVIGDPTAFGDLVPQTALPYVATIAVFGFSSATLLCLVVRSIRQLRMVRKLHARATNISLLKLEPAQAFSTLTARTGIGIILFLLLGYAYRLVVDPVVVATTVNMVGYAVSALIAVIVFVMPVMGLRGRIEEEKQRALDETSDLLQVTSDGLHDMIRNRGYDDLKGMETAISALIRERELIQGISTWPWDPRTIRGFATTLLLPIFLWLATRLLERFV
jgi:hypothetical protein